MNDYARITSTNRWVRRRERERSGVFSHFHTLSEVLLRVAMCVR